MSPEPDKSKTVVIMQPGYLPWLGFFDLIIRSDVFVIYDSVQFDKGGWRNRNRIKSHQGASWLSIPVCKAPLDTKMLEIQVNDTLKWRSKHLKTIKQYYSKTPYFKEIYVLIEDVLMSKTSSLLEIDEKAILSFCHYMGIETNMIRSSELKQTETERIAKLIEICKTLDADIFYEPSGGKPYLEDQVQHFKNQGLDLVFQEYKHPVYRQQFGEFVPYLSIIDCLFNEGPNSLDIIMHKNS